MEKGTFGQCIVKHEGRSAKTRILDGAASEGGARRRCNGGGGRWSFRRGGCVNVKNEEEEVMREGDE